MAGDLAELAEQVAALKHDLGKYVAWMSANLGDELWRPPVRDELLAALQRDLLRTRTDAAGAPETAWEVWSRFAAGRSDLPPEPELREVAAAVATLHAAEPALREGDRAALAPVLGDIRAAQQAIRAALQQLHRRLQQAQRG